MLRDFSLRSKWGLGSVFAGFDADFALGGVEPRRVADAVERLRLRELLVDERDGMAPRRERPREVLYAIYV